MGYNCGEAPGTATGKPSTLDRIKDRLSTFPSKNYTLRWEDVTRLTEIMTTACDIIASDVGVSNQQLKDLIAAGKVPFTPRLAAKLLREAYTVRDDTSYKMSAAPSVLPDYARSDKRARDARELAANGQMWRSMDSAPRESCSQIIAKGWHLRRHGARAEFGVERVFWINGEWLDADAGGFDPIGWMPWPTTNEPK